MAVSKFSLALTLAILSIWAVDAAHHHAAAPSPSFSSSPSPSPSPSVDCSSLILNMADCLLFVSSGSQVSKPGGTCCSGLKTVLKTSAECLCEALKSSASLGFPLNVTKALTLPAVCKVSAPSVTNCNISLAPAGAPGLQPSTTAGAPTPLTGGASQAAPAPAPGSSGSPVLSVSIGSLVVGLTIMLVSGY